MTGNDGQPLVIVADGESPFVAGANDLITQLVRLGYLARAMYTGRLARVDDPPEDTEGFLAVLFRAEIERNNICPHALRQAEGYGEMSPRGQGCWDLRPPEGYRFGGWLEKFTMVRE